MSDRSLHLPDDALEEQAREPSSHPHACYEGWVLLGIIELNEDGEEEERVLRVRCHRCASDWTLERR